MVGCLIDPHVPAPDARPGGLLRSRSGATAVEFALVAPIFLLVMIGMFDMSRAMWIKATLQFSVEKATRAFAVNNALSTSDLIAAAEGFCTGAGMSSTVCSGAFSATQTTSGSIDIMQVTASYNFETVASAIEYRGQSLLPFSNVTLTGHSAVPLNS